MLRKKKPDGFTLIELLVVIAIIAILAALVLSTAGMIQKQGAKARAKAEVEALSTALESYKTEYGDYPESSTLGSAGSRVLYNALVLSGTANPLGKVFFEPTKGILSTSNYSDPNNYFVDPFGVSYNYRYIAGTNGTNNFSGIGFFDLWSYGGATGTKTNTNSTNWVFWIANW